MQIHQPSLLSWRRKYRNYPETVVALTFPTIQLFSSPIKPQVMLCALISSVFFFAVPSTGAVLSPGMFLDIYNSLIKTKESWFSLRAPLLVFPGQCMLHTEQCLPTRGCPLLFHIACIAPLCILLSSTRL